MLLCCILLITTVIIILWYRYYPFSLINPVSWMQRYIELVDGVSQSYLFAEQSVCADMTKKCNIPLLFIDQPVVNMGVNVVAMYLIHNWTCFEKDYYNGLSGPWVDSSYDGIISNQRLLRSKSKTLDELYWTLLSNVLRNASHASEQQLSEYSAVLRRIDAQAMACPLDIVCIYCIFMMFVFFTFFFYLIFNTCRCICTFFNLSIFLWY